MLKPIKELLSRRRLLKQTGVPIVLCVFLFLNRYALEVRSEQSEGREGRHTKCHVFQEEPETRLSGNVLVSIRERVR